MSEQNPRPSQENSGLTGLDLLIAEAAREGAADSFGPYFAERTVERALKPAAPRSARSIPRVFSAACFARPSL